MMPISPWSPRGVQASERRTSPIATRAPGGQFKGASPSEDSTASLISRSRPSSDSATCIISMEGPPSGSFSRATTNARRSVPKSASSRVLTSCGGSLPAQRAGSAMMLTRSFRQRRSRAASSAADSSDVPTSDLRRPRQYRLRPAPAEFGQKLLRMNVERILLEHAADDDHRVRSHDVDDGVAGELPEVVGADDRIVVTPPHGVDARLELDDVLDEQSPLGRPVHAADDAAAGKSVRRLAAGQLLEHFQHAILVEMPLPQVRVGVAPQLELAALLGGGRVDPRGGETSQMVEPLIRIDDVERF